MTTPETPEANLSGDPWHSDGRRVVLSLLPESTALREVDIVDSDRDGP